MGAKDKSSKVFADIDKNRLYITLCGTLTKKIIENIYTDIRFCVADLEPGFDVITDMTEGRLGHLSGVSVFKKISYFLLSNGVGTVVRVTGKQTVIAKQMNRLTEIMQGYRPLYAKNMDEAEELLKNVERDV